MQTASYFVTIQGLVCMCILCVSLCKYSCMCLCVALICTLLLQKTCLLLQAVAFYSLFSRFSLSLSLPCQVFCHIKLIINRLKIIMSCHVAFMQTLIFLLFFIIRFLFITLSLFLNLRWNCWLFCPHCLTAKNELSFISQMMED